MELATAVITTCKRKPIIVERALKSVLAQTYSPIEVLVVDDSPAEYEERGAVREMIERYREHGVRYIEHPQCMGACAARNTGLSAANGTFIGFLDDDDEWLPEKVAVLSDLLRRDPACALAFGRSISVNDETGERTPRSEICYRGMVFDRLIFGNFVGSTSFPLMRRDRLVEVGGFDVGMMSAQDYDVWLRLAQKYTFDYVEQPLVLYHWHSGEQITKNPQKRIQGLERLNAKHRDYLRVHPEARFIRTIKLAPEYAKNRQFRKALGTWFSAAVRRPWKIRVNLKYLYSIFCIKIGR